MLFKKTKQLEQKVDEYLDFLSKAALVFKEGINNYLNDQQDEFNRHLEELRELENKADELRRTVETYLYLHTLIPESRGDVLALLENTDNVTDQAKGALMKFSVEIPEIAPELHQDFRDLTKYVVESFESMVTCTRAFFRDLNAVRDNLHKVHFYEKEADKISEKLRRKIFASENIPRLSHKMHLRNCIDHIDSIADYAEDVADRLAIYTIKRSI